MAPSTPKPTNSRSPLRSHAPSAIPEGAFYLPEDAHRFQPDGHHKFSKEATTSLAERAPQALPGGHYKPCRTGSPGCRDDRPAQNAPRPANSSVKRLAEPVYSLNLHPSTTLQLWPEYSSQPCCSCSPSRPRHRRPATPSPSSPPTDIPPTSAGVPRAATPRSRYSVRGRASRSSATPRGTSPRRSYSSTARVKPRAAWAKPPTPQQPSTAAIST